jgi:site-specific recombinase XerD
MEGFLSDLAETDVSAATQNQAFSAVLFFYRNIMKEEPGDVNALRARKSTFLRHAPAKDKVRRILEKLEDSPSYPFRLIVFMIYGLGARVSEPIGVRIRDIDLSKKRIILRQAKGSKDRMVPIPDCLLAPIHRQMTAAEAVWKRAMAQRVPVKLPNKLGKKYKSAGVEFEWFWLFPAPKSCICRRSKERVWWHCMPDAVQDAMRAACKAAGIPGAVKPHDLRHSWATHASDDGANIRDIQEILGHKSLETTMIYVHTEIERVASPLESLNIAV